MKQTDNVQIISSGALETNTYIVSSRNSCVVVDPGEHTEEIMFQLSKISKNVEAVLLTHGHYDHIASANEISNYFNCPILANEHEFEILKDCEKNYSRIRLDSCIEIDEILLPLKNSFKLADFEIEAIHTPGHTKGSVCFWFKGLDFLFTGDTLFYYDVGRCDLYSGNIKDMYESLGTLSELPGNLLVYPGHGPSGSLNEYLTVNEYLKKSARRKQLTKKI